MKRIARDVRFMVERGMLVRHVQRADGRGYIHRASLAAIQEVAWFVDEHAAEGVTTNELWEALVEVPATQASVALEFLKECGCLETRGRRNFPASSCLFEEAMIEFHALEHQAATALPRRQ